MCISIIHSLLTINEYRDKKKSNWISSLQWKGPLRSSRASSVNKKTALTNSIFCRLILVSVSVVQRNSNSTDSNRSPWKIIIAMASTEPKHYLVFVNVNFGVSARLSTSNPFEIQLEFDKILFAEIVHTRPTKYKKFPAKFPVSTAKMW